MNESEFGKDESFVVQAIAKHSQINDLQQALNDHFNNKYSKKLGEIKINFDENIHDWVISTEKGEKRVGYAESIPKAIHEFLS